MKQRLALESGPLPHATGCRSKRLACERACVTNFVGKYLHDACAVRLGLHAKVPRREIAAGESPRGLRAAAHHEVSIQFARVVLEVGHTFELKKRHRQDLQSAVWSLAFVI